MTPTQVKLLNPLVALAIKEQPELEEDLTKHCIMNAMLAKIHFGNEDECGKWIMKQLGNLL